jgi:hypothetical protein
MTAPTSLGLGQHRNMACIDSDRGRADFLSHCSQDWDQSSDLVGYYEPGGLVLPSSLSHCFIETPAESRRLRSSHNAGLRGWQILGKVLSERVWRQGEKTGGRHLKRAERNDARAKERLSKDAAIIVVAVANRHFIVSPYGNSWMCPITSLNIGNRLIERNPMDFV